ncbi:MAG: DUF1003 domain-containing protein [Planctomycetota bacterium]
MSSRSPDPVPPKPAPPSAQRRCSLCGRAQPAARLVHARGLRSALAEELAKRHPGAWSEDAQVCLDCRSAARVDHLLAELERERGELSEVEAEVARQAASHLAIAEQIDEQFERGITRGQRFADHVARVGGSWPFVIGFGVVLLVWIALNVLLLRERAFDPYPFILLNLVLSCVAALQAPIIMMSQDRMAARDRLQADQDFRVNLKAEIEVRSLHDKLDHVLHAQWQHMVEMQQLQIDLLNEILAARGKAGKG